MFTFLIFSYSGDDGNTSPGTGLGFNRGPTSREESKEGPLESLSSPSTFTPDRSSTKEEEPKSLGTSGRNKTGREDEEDIELLQSTFDLDTGEYVSSKQKKKALQRMDEDEEDDARYAGMDSEMENVRGVELIQSSFDLDTEEATSSKQKRAQKQSGGGKKMMMIEEFSSSEDEEENESSSSGEDEKQTQKQQRDSKRRSDRGVLKVNSFKNPLR